MQRQVWGPAQSDSVSALKYFNKNRSKYNWTKSVDAVIFYANDINAAKTFTGELKKSPRSWNELVNRFSEKITADSSRFETGQIPGAAGQKLMAGTITTPVLNRADNTASFAYILHVYDKPAPRNFAEARGLVVNDYQKELEKNWVAELKNKYPVKINQSVVAQLIRRGSFEKAVS